MKENKKCKWYFLGFCHLFMEGVCSLNENCKLKQKHENEKL